MSLPWGFIVTATYDLALQLAAIVVHLTLLQNVTRVTTDRIRLDMAI